MKSSLLLPWKRPSFALWSIVGMNHYRDEAGIKQLYVAMADGFGYCVKAEGHDIAELWDELESKVQQIEAHKSKLKGL